MSLYKNSNFLKSSESPAFDAVHQPGANTDNSGIYRCEACGHEITSNKGNPLPPQNHHQHTTGGPIRWRLTVYAETR